MYAVINHLYLSAPIEQIRQSAEQDLVPMFRDLPGFCRFKLVKVAEDHLIAIIYWESLENANYGASVIGPT